MVETPPAEIYNLALVLAYAVLDQVLNELMDQGEFPPPISKQNKLVKNPNLGMKMAASQNGLRWVNYLLVEQGKDARNKIAHEAKLLTKPDCFSFIDSIEDELKAWRVI